MKSVCSILTYVLVAVLLTGCVSSSTDGQRLARYRPRTDDRNPWSSKIAPADEGSRETSEPSVVLDSPQINKPLVENPDSPRENGYRSSRPLRRGDKIYIDLRGIPVPEKVEGVIDDEGNITLPLIGEIAIEGKTTSEAGRIINKIYVESGYYTKIDVIIVAQVEEYFVGGEVNRVGKYPLSGDLTLLQAIMEAGDFTEFANRRKIKVIRGKEVLHFDGKKIVQRKDEDPIVKPDDIIIVPKRWW